MGDDVRDSPHYFVYGACWSCRRGFSFNPSRVPSVPVDPESGEIRSGGVRQPICRDCATAANVDRKINGLPLWDTSDAAYEPVEGFPD
jgi:hypothetical protein